VERTSNQILHLFNKFHENGLGSHKRIGSGVVLTLNMCGGPQLLDLVRTPNIKINTVKFVHGFEKCTK
jgi:hypothetical protein